MPERVQLALARNEVVYLGQLARVGEWDVLSWRGIGGVGFRLLRTSIERLARDLARIDGVDHLSKEDLLERLTLQDPLLDLVDRACSQLAPNRREVLARRTFAWPLHATLEDVGRSVGLTRERVRQLEDRSVRALSPGGGLGAFLDAALLRMRAGRRRPLLLEDLERDDPWFEGVARRPGVLRGLLHKLECRHVLTAAWGEGAPIVTLGRGADPGDVLIRFTKFAGEHAEESDLVRLDGLFLKENETPELLPLLVAALERGFAQSRTHTDFLAEILEEAQRPMTRAEMLRRLSARGHPIPPGSLGNALGDLPVVRTSRNTYVARSALARWDSLRSPFAAAVSRIFATAPRRQWSTEDILEALRREGPPRMRSLAPHVVEHLLRESPRVVRLKRNLWGLAGVGESKRLPVRDVAASILAKARTPLTTRELRRRVEEVRSLSADIAIKWPLVRLGDGRVGLGERDLRVSTEAHRRVCALVIADLKRGAGAVPAARLLALYRRAAPGVAAPSPRVLARMIVPEARARLDAQGTGLREREARR